MKKAAMVFAAAFGALAAFGIAASQAWVSNYVERAIASSQSELQSTATVTATNGMTEYHVGSGSDRVRLIVETSTDAAMLATNCTAAATAQGITNGLLFVWNGGTLYRNPNGTITATPTNLVFSGVSSVHANGYERFTGWFDAKGVLIQPGTSFAITNGMTEAHQ